MQQKCNPFAGRPRLLVDRRELTYILSIAVLHGPEHHETNLRNLRRNFKVLQMPQGRTADAIVDVWHINVVMFDQSKLLFVRRFDQGQYENIGMLEGIPAFHIPSKTVPIKNALLIIML